MRTTDLTAAFMPRKKNKYEKKTRGQRPNESQKAVIIDVMKSVGEKASKIWPVV